MESITFLTREPWIFPWSAAAARSFFKSLFADFGLRCQNGWPAIGGNYSGAQTPYFDRNEKELFFSRDVVR